MTSTATSESTVGPAAAAGPRATGFVHAEGGRLVDGSGRPVLLRGTALGGWLLPEGYMWGLGDGAQSPRQIESLVERLVGPRRAGAFWREYREAFVTERDVTEIAAYGLDHVRVPINARVVQGPDGEPLEDGYRLLDRLIGWCREHGLLVLLDLHGAPGGQTGTNIDDSPRGRPELFLEPRYRELTLRLWSDLAARYAGEPAVLGYDLLNEPLPDEWQHRFADELVGLYGDLTAAIRAVDPDHLLMFEGMHWATNFDIFTQVWDPNSCLQFHKYWSAPDEASLRPFLAARDRLGLPLYMGEGGENTLDWLYTAFRLYERFEIGWNLWPWKKLDTRTSPVSITPPTGWDAFAASVQGSARLSPVEAGAVLDELVANVRVEAATPRPEVVAAVLGERPVTVPAWGFGFRGPGESYGVADARPFAAARADDAVSLTWAGPGEHPANPFEQGDGRDYRPDELVGAHLQAGDWLEFEVEGVPDASVYTAQVASGQAEDVTLERSRRGVRAVAHGDVTLLRIVLDRDDVDGEGP